MFVTVLRLSLTPCAAAMPNGGGGSSDSEAMEEQLRGTVRDEADETLDRARLGLDYSHNHVEVRDSTAEVVPRDTTVGRPKSMAMSSQGGGKDKTPRYHFERMLMLLPTRLNRHGSGERLYFVTTTGMESRFEGDQQTFIATSTGRWVSAREVARMYGFDENVVHPGDTRDGPYQ